MAKEYKYKRTILVQKRQDLNAKEFCSGCFFETSSIKMAACWAYDKEGDLLYPCNPLIIYIKKPK